MHAMLKIVFFSLVQLKYLKQEKALKLVFRKSSFTSVYILPHQQIILKQFANGIIFI